MYQYHFRNFLFTIIFIFIFSKPYAQSVGNYFSSHIIIPDDSVVKKYVVLQDGKTIYGDKVDIGGSLRLMVIVDKERYEVKDVKYIQLGRIKGSRYNSKLYTNINNNLYETIVKGDRISVYQSTFTFYDGDKINRYFYIKPGNKPVILKSMDDVAEAIGDCKALKFLKNMDKSDLGSERKENERFLNECFEKYNTLCK